MAVAADRGFVFATTGPDYTVLARRAARSLRLVLPEAQVDLFSDQPLDDPVFDRIHRLDHNFFRPKMEALSRSRFARSVYLDADILVLHDISALFDLLDRCEVAGAWEPSRRPAMMERDAAIPRAFPCVNSGVLAVRQSPATQALLAEWERQVRDTGARNDQSTLRRLLYHSDISLMILPEEYNLIALAGLDAWLALRGAPHVLHARQLHMRPPGDPMQPFDLDEVLDNPERAAHVRRLAGHDATIGGDHSSRAPTPVARLKRQARAAAATRSRRFLSGGIPGLRRR